MKPYLKIQSEDAIRYEREMMESAKRYQQTLLDNTDAEVEARVEARMREKAEEARIEAQMQQIFQQQTLQQQALQMQQPIYGAYGQTQSYSAPPANGFPEIQYQSVPWEQRLNGTSNPSRFCKHCVEVGTPEAKANCLYCRNMAMEEKREVQRRSGEGNYRSDRFLLANPNPNPNYRSDRFLLANPNPNYRSDRFLLAPGSHNVNPRSTEALGGT